MILLKKSQRWMGCLVIFSTGLSSLGAMEMTEISERKGEDLGGERRERRGELEREEEENDHRVPPDNLKEKKKKRKTLSEKEC